MSPPVAITSFAPPSTVSAPADRARCAGLRSYLAFSLAEGGLSAPLASFATPGNFLLTALLVSALGLPLEIYGLCISLRLWCNFLQPLIFPLVGRRWPSRSVYLASSLLYLGLWIALALSLFVIDPAEVYTVSLWMLALLFGANLAGAVARVAWMAWMHDWVPPTVYGSFFARRHGLRQLVGWLFLLLAGAWLHFVALDVTIFAWLLLGAVLLRIVAWLFSQRIAAGQAPPASPPDGLGGELIVARRDVPFVRFMVFSIGLGFLLSCFEPFVPVFMLRHLGLSAGVFGWCMSLATLAGALAYPGWGRVSDRSGDKRVLLYALGLWIMANSLWFFVTPASAPWIAYPIWALHGVAGAGLVLGKINLLLKLTPPKAKVVSLSLASAAAPLVAGLAPVLTGWFLSVEDGVPAAGLGQFKLLFAFLPVFGLGVLWTLHRLDVEKKPAPFYPAAVPGVPGGGVRSIDGRSRSWSRFAGTAMRRPRVAEVLAGD